MGDKLETHCPHYRLGTCRLNYVPITCTRQHLVFSQHTNNASTETCGQLLRKIALCVETEQLEELDEMLTVLGPVSEFTVAVYNNLLKEQHGQRAECKKGSDR